jgi:hypothetical protein
MAFLRFCASFNFRYHRHLAPFHCASASFLALLPFPFQGLPMAARGFETGSSAYYTVSFSDFDFEIRA